MFASNTVHVKYKTSNYVIGASFSRTGISLAVIRYGHRYANDLGQA